MLKAYKYYLQPSQEQKTLINRHLGSCRWLYNYALNKKNNGFKSKKLFRGRMLRWASGVVNNSWDYERRKYINTN